VLCLQLLLDHPDLTPFDLRLYLADRLVAELRRVLVVGEEAAQA
jgi:hypothetical protein